LVVVASDIRTRCKPGLEIKSNAVVTLIFAWEDEPHLPMEKRLLRKKAKQRGLTTIVQ
jgi:hypothetical protein